MKSLKLGTMMITAVLLGACGTVERPQTQIESVLAIPLVEVDQNMFEQLEFGMSIEEVKEVIGSEPTSQYEGVRTLMAWQGENESIEVAFYNGLAETLHYSGHDVNDETIGKILDSLNFNDFVLGEEASTMIKQIGIEPTSESMWDDEGFFYHEKHWTDMTNWFDADWEHKGISILSINGIVASISHGGLNRNESTSGIGINETALEKLQNGMSVEEVQELIGQIPDSKAFLGFIPDSENNQVRMEWSNRDFWIDVRFVNGVVTFFQGGEIVRTS